MLSVAAMESEREREGGRWWWIKTKRKACTTVEIQGALFFGFVCLHNYRWPFIVLFWPCPISGNHIHHCLC